MKTSESIYLLVEGLRKAETMLEESERMHPPYFAPLVSLTALAVECAALATQVEDLKETFAESTITTAAYFLRVEQSLEAIRQAFEESKR